MIEMELTEGNIQKALRVERAVSEFFENSTETKVQAKELMSLFIEKGIFTSNHRDGLPIRNLLRLLEKNNQLDLIPHAEYEQKAQNKNWFFTS